MFYIIRCIVYLAILMILFFINKKFKFVFFLNPKKQPEMYEFMMTHKKHRRNSVLIKLGVAVGLILLAVGISYPLEGHFIQFSSVEDSFSYKWIDKEGLDIHTYEDFVFAVNKDGDEIYTLTRKNGGYGLVDFSADEATFNALRVTDKSTVQNDVVEAKYNKETKKSFYVVDIDSDDKPDEGIVKYNGKEIVFYDKFKYTNVFNYEYYVWRYIYSDNNELPKEFTLDTEGMTTVFHNQNYPYINFG